METTHLHILTANANEVAASVMSAQTAKGEKIEVFDLREGTPDYSALLDRVFAAESVAVW